MRLGNDDRVAVAHTDVEIIVAEAEAVVLLGREELPSDIREFPALRDRLGLAIGEFQNTVRALIGPIRERR